MSPHLPHHVTRRSADLKKGEWGRLLILGGSSQLAGAAVLNTLGALRTGVDVVVAAAPDRASTAILHQAPDAVTITLPGHHFQTRYLKFLRQFHHYTIVIGSGITTHPDVVKFVKKILDRFNGPLVVDADAIRVVAASRHPARLWKGKEVLLMPNRKEYAVLSGDDSHPLKTIAAVARKYGTAVLCTGPVDILSDGEYVVEIAGGSEFLAKAGTGDVLAGSVGALMARGVPAFQAAETACRLINEASHQAEKAHGPGMLASDVAKLINLAELPKQPSKDQAKEPPEVAPESATKA